MKRKSAPSHRTPCTTSSKLGDLSRRWGAALFGHHSRSSRVHIPFFKLDHITVNIGSSFATHTYARLHKNTRLNLIKFADVMPMLLYPAAHHVLAVLGVRERIFCPLCMYKYMQFGFCIVAVCRRVYWANIQTGSGSFTTNSRITSHHINGVEGIVSSNMY